MKQRYEIITGHSKHYFYFLILVYFSAVSSLNSCCSNRGCLGADNLDGVYLKNFAPGDVDSIFVSSYKKGTDFTIRTDSFMVEKCDSSGNGDYYMFFNGKMINMNNDYKFYFTRLDKVYNVEGFKTSKSECNDCFFKEYYSRLDKYQINSNLKNLDVIKIDKDTD